MEWKVCCATVVLVAILVTPLVEARGANGTSHVVPKGDHVMPKGSVRQDDCLEEGYYVIPVGDTVCVASPGYPGKYENRADSLWQLDSSDEDGYLSVQCTEFKLQKSRNCKADSLTVIHEETEEKYCGKNGPGEFDTPSYWMDFQFKSNKKKNNKGFKCYVTALGNSSPSTEASTVGSTEYTPGSTAAPPSTAAPNPNCDCGVKNPSRIVGGSPASANEYPWLVGLSSNNNNNSPFCGGSVYNSEWIITAAHCIDGTSPSSIKVVLGMHNYATNTPAPTSIEVAEIIAHENYNDRTLDHDIALLRLESPITFSDKIRSVCLPGANMDYAGQTATVTGWGTTSSGGSSPNMNHYIEVPIRTEQECDASYPGEITDNMICAGTPAFDKDSCQGDSGGPLTVPVNGHHYLAGIVSWGYYCARDPWYGVYTDVPNYNSWIIGKAGSPRCTP